MTGTGEDTRYHQLICICNNKLKEIEMLSNSLTDIDRDKKIVDQSQKNLEDIQRKEKKKLEEESKREKRGVKNRTNIIMELEIERVIRKSWQMDTLFTFPRCLFPIRPHESFTHQLQKYKKIVKNIEGEIFYCY